MPGSALPAKREPLEQARAPRRVAEREQRDRQRRDDRDRRRRGSRRRGRRAPGSMEARGPVVDDRPLEPVPEHERGQREERRHHEAAPGEGRHAPAAERDGLCAARRPRVRAVVPSAGADAASQRQRHRGEADEHEREHRRRGAVEQAAVLQVDGAGEGVVPHQRDDPEVGERVERDEQRAERDRRAHRRQRDPEEHRATGTRRGSRAASSGPGSRSRSAAWVSRNT